MNSEIKVSVLCITYAHEKYISDCLQGILNQDAPFPVEVIVANDNSPDSTDMIVKATIENHKNGSWVKYTKHSINKGGNDNFIWGLKQCKGEFIALCEGDDYWTDRDKLKKQLKILESNENYSMCFSHQLEVNSEGEEIMRHQYSKELYKTYDVVGGFIPATQTVMFKNFSCIPNWMERVKELPSGDRLLAFFCSQLGDLYLLSEYTAAYRRTGEGMWTSLDAKEQYFTSLETFIKFHLTIGMPVNNELVHSKMNGSFFYWIKKNPNEIIKIMNRVNSLKRKYGIKTSLLLYIFKKLSK